ncbi:MAG: YncE family protein [Eubacteriales bacterium]|jgi:DNA-binding beta-propeller fold protein YncE
MNCDWGSTIVVVHKGSSEIGFYNGDGTFSHAVKVGRHPHELTCTADRKTAYVTNFGQMLLIHPGEGDNSVAVIDVENRKLADTISLGNFRRPHGIFLDEETGLLAVSTANPDALVMVDTVKGCVAKTYQVSGNTAHCVTLNKGATWAYISMARSDSLCVVRLEDGWMKEIPVGPNPQQSVLSLDEKELFVTCGEYISVIDTEKLEEVDRIQDSAIRIVMLPKDNLVAYAVAAEGERRGIGFANPTTREIVGHVPMEYQPWSISVSYNGKYVFASAEEQDLVYVISVAEKKIVGSMKTPTGAAPDPVMDAPY